MRTPTRPPRRGLTRVEAVVLAVIGLVLLGVFVARIDRHREEAKYLRCVANLEEIGRGIRVFADTKHNKLLPAARIAERHATWAVQIAPYLPAQDQDADLKRWDMQLPYYDQPAEVRAAQALAYYCPSRRAPPQLSVRGDVPTDGKPARKDYPGALGDYAGAAGDGGPARPWDGPLADGALVLGEVRKRDGRRVLSWRSRTKLEDLPRGQTYTILVGEKHVPLGRFGEADQGDGSLYNGDHPANSSRVGGPGHGLARSPEEPFNLNFGSYHPGRCNFLFADGNVKSLAPSVPEAVLGRLVNRFDGRPPPGKGRVKR
jgi:prepilin-type processing-associated H-X9-DG protein